MSKSGMNVIYDESKIGKFNYENFSPEDRIRMRELRLEIRGLWFPERKNEVKEWRRKVGINAKGELDYFAHLTRKQKQEFFDRAHKFIEEIKSESRKKFEHIYKNFKLTKDYCLKILGVSEDSTLKEIKKNYRKLVMIHHPDRGGNPETFIKLNEAYKYLIGDDR